jgi:hypothetical protein
MGQNLSNDVQYKTADISGRAERETPANFRECLLLG